MRHIIVTGTSRGFGQEISRQMASPETHIHLVARSSSRTAREAIREKGGKATEYQFDLTEERQVRDLMESIFAPIDLNDTDFIGLVNNAGTLEPIGPLGKYETGAYRKNLEINFVAPAILTHLFIKRVQHLDLEKRVVFISSGAAQKPYVGWSHYCSTKAGVDMLMKTAHQEQITMNKPVKLMGFNPGRIETDMQELIRSQEEEDFPAVQDFIEAKHDGRTAPADDVAAVLADIMKGDDFPAGEVVSGKRYLH